MFADAQQLLKRIVDEKLLTARGVYGFWPAASDGDDIRVFADENRTKELTRFHTLRQQWERKGQKAYYALADFVAPEDSGRQDFIGAFAVTAGIGTDELVRRFEAQHDDHGAILVKSLADRMAEAFAEMLHQRARRDWGYGGEETLTNDELIEEKYRGIRPRPATLPARTTPRSAPLFDLLSAESNAGMTLTENFAMYPAASVSGLYFAHPGGAVFCGGPHHVRSGGELRRAQGDDRGRGRALAGAEFGVRPRITGRRAVRDLRPCHAARFQRSSCDVGIANRRICST